MRELEFEVLPAFGPSSERRKGSPVDLLHAIPYLLFAGIIPPHAVLREVFARGLMDAGMSGGVRWEPFALQTDESAEIGAALQRAGFEPASAPDWVQTLYDWPIWIMEHRFGVPSDEHRRLMQRVLALEAERDAARDAGDQDRFEELHVAVFRADQELGEFVRCYLPGPRA